MRYSETTEDRMDIREPRAIYVPVFDSFFESSIMNEALTTRFVFLALLRLAWRPRSGGVVDVDLRMFSASINIPFDEVEAAIKRLMEPDPESGSKLEEGRRIAPIDPKRPMRGWRLVNWSLYQDVLHKANDKVRKKNQRSRDKAGQSGQSGHVTHNTIQDETKQEEKNIKRESARFVAPTVEEVRTYANEKGLSLDAVYFVDFFEAKGWVTGKTKMRDWKAAARNAARDGWTKKNGPPEKAKQKLSPEDELYREAEIRTRKEIAESIRLRKEKGLPV